jgi:large subunit ribosomal protein L19
MKILQIKAGQLLEIHETIGEWDNKRNWKFRCLVLSTKNVSHPSGTFLVRWVSSWVVIEKIYPFCFDKFTKIVLLDEFKTRRAKLYYLRDKVGKWAKMKSIISSDRRNMDLLTLQIVPVVEEVVIAPAIVDESLESVTIEPAQLKKLLTDTTSAE